MKNEAIEAVKLVREFTSRDQYQAMRAGLRGEESQHFQDKFMEYGQRIAGMPKTYEQDGKGDQAIVYLHYFNASQDWYITEKDAETPEEPGQRQAFGLADLGHYGAELGYISIVELIAHNVELDLYFKPLTLAEIKAKKAA